MLKKKRLYHYFNERWILMLSHLVAFCNNLNQEELHRFRVEIKKIRALIKLLENCSVKKELSLPLRPLVHLFKEAGEVRDMYVKLMLVPIRKNTVLERKMNTRIKSFCARIPQFVTGIEKTYDALVGAFDDIKNDCVTKWYRKQLEKLETRLKNKTQWHNSRKKLKALLHIYDVLHKTLRKKLDLDLGYLHDLEEKLGHWHDLEVSLSLADGEVAKIPVIALESDRAEAVETLNGITQNFGRAHA